MDVALFPVSADPPITAVEVDFLQEVRSDVARLFFVLNKVDYLSDDEQRDTIAFLENILRTRAGFDHDVTIFPVSARQGLESGERTWEASGMAALEQAHRTRRQAADVLAGNRARSLEQIDAAETYFEDQQATEAAIEAALQRRERHADAVTPTVQDLEELETRLRATLTMLETEKMPSSCEPNDNPTDAVHSS